MTRFLICFAVAIPLHLGLAHPRDVHSKNSEIVIRVNPGDSNAIVITPDGKSIGVIFPDDSPLWLIVAPNVSYSVGVEHSPTPEDLAWITLSDKSGFVDCVIISKEKTVSFANADIINQLRRNEIMARELLESFTEELNRLVKDELND